MSKKTKIRRKFWPVLMALSMCWSMTETMPAYAAVDSTIVEAASHQQTVSVSGIPSKIPASAIGLPTNGADITDKRPVLSADGKVAYFAVRGFIHPVDNRASDIEFQVNLPTNWNRKMTQFGGGGFDGVLITADGQSVCEDRNDVAPVLQGYVTFGSDGGHKGDTWESEWALNDENLHNFAHQQLKKTHDAALYITEQFYGEKPQKMYFIGGSNGGREALKAVQEYPNDYDGAVAFYPVLNWIPKAIKDNENGVVVRQSSGAGWLSESEYELVKQTVLEIADKLDGQQDGLIGNAEAADSRQDEIMKKLQGHLSPAQLKALAAFWSKRDFSQPLKNGFSSMPGYSVSQLLIDHGDPYIFNQFGSKPGEKDGAMMMFSDGVIRCQIMRDKNFSSDDFRAEEHPKEVLEASNWLDATETNLDRFVKRGGKLILLHGTADEVVSLQGTTDYYRELAKRYGNKLELFARYYIVPGFGHQTGSVFTMGRDILSDLDKWVTKNEQPQQLTVKDQNKATYGRTQILLPYNASR